MYYGKKDFLRKTLSSEAFQGISEIDFLDLNGKSPMLYVDKFLDIAPVFP